MNILVSDPIGQSGLDLLIKMGHSIEYQPTISSDDLVSKIHSYDALIVRSRTKVTDEVIQKGTQLKIIARAGAGVDTIDIQSAAKKGIRVVNAPGANSEAVAEHTFALILALSRDIVRTSVATAAGSWVKSSYRGMELRGKTLGIFGFGHIGERVAELGIAFGMNVLVFTKSHLPERAKRIQSIGASEASSSIVLAQSDVISIHMSLTPQTTGMFTSELFAQMKPIAYFINTSRGAIVDEKSLIHALETGLIAGAALDVFAQEPLLSSSPLCHMENVILTPHVAANSKESEERASLMVAEDIHRISCGELPVREVHI